MSRRLYNSLERQKESVLARAEVALDAVARYARRTMRHRPPSENVDASGLPFAPYAESTVRRKGTTRVTLVEGNTMLRDLEVDRTRPLERRIAPKSSAEMQKLIWHQFGTENEDGSERMPARTVVGLRTREEEEARRQFAAEMAKVKGGGRLQLTLEVVTV